MNNIDWALLKPIIEQNQTFIITSHVRPDLDALGSELALAILLESLGKQVSVINGSDMPDGLRFIDEEDRVQKYVPSKHRDLILGSDVHFIVDTSAWKQLGTIADLFKTTTAKKVVIDHHASSDDLQALEFKDPLAEATGTLIYRMMKVCGYPVQPEMATPLYGAIATDTGWFRFSSTTSETHRIIADLIDLGVKADHLYQQLYERYSIERTKLVSRILGRVELECDGQLVYVYVQWKDFTETGAKPVDTEDLVNECLRINGTRAAFIAVEQQNKTVKFSLRSRSDVDVSQVAEIFGGGGHKKAAGAVLTEPFPQALTKVRDAMKEAVMTLADHPA
ncbi:NanoRNase/pAp phosphatase [Polystyrenella longa]|uniref:NanoRNase/pAp phosphatase n=1 Tax=Polystyrenella longa TaxID=2528007 RepID=A0A518CMW8_9PLAN|nr:bifunctional oligoribonuclease/PAP phosphatase NrnA [Polystyrenella longa]QDU80568.1 NanoRNase/pAp phosphatase [Polystyrenella longa]